MISSPRRSHWAVVVHIRRHSQRMLRISAAMEKKIPRKMKVEIRAMAKLCTAGTRLRERLLELGYTPPRSPSIRSLAHFRVIPFSRLGEDVSASAAIKISRPAKRLKKFRSKCARAKPLLAIFSLKDICPCKP